MGKGSEIKVANVQLRPLVETGIPNTVGLYQLKLSQTQWWGWTSSSATIPQNAKIWSTVLFCTWYSIWSSVTWPLRWMVADSFLKRYLDFCLLWVLGKRMTVLKRGALSVHLQSSSWKVGSYFSIFGTRNVKLYLVDSIWGIFTRKHCTSVMSSMGNKKVGRNSFLALHSIRLVRYLGRLRHLIDSGIVWITSLPCKMIRNWFWMRRICAFTLSNLLSSNFCHQVHGDTLEMREMAARICRDYLNGPWKKVTTQDIGFKHIRSVGYFFFLKNTF